MTQNTHSRRIRSFLAATLICFGCLLYMTACNSKPELEAINDIQNPDSPLVKALNCDESLGLRDGWSWETKVITQRNEDSDGYEWTDCRLGGHYDDTSSPDHRYDFVFFSGIEKYKAKTTLDGSAVATISGKEIATPNFVKLGQVMFSRCAKYKENTVHCLINIQYDGYTMSYLRIDFDNHIHLSHVETLSNMILTQEDALIKKELVP